MCRLSEWAIEIARLLILGRSSRESMKYLVVENILSYLFVLTVGPAKVTTVFDFNFFKSRNCFAGIRMLSKIIFLHEELTAAWTSVNFVTVMGQF
jgi:hypothetical protein